MFLRRKFARLEVAKGVPKYFEYLVRFCHRYRLRGERCPVKFRLLGRTSLRNFLAQSPQRVLIEGNRDWCGLADGGETDAVLNRLWSPWLRIRLGDEGGVVGPFI